MQIKWRTSYESLRDSLQLFGIARIPAGQYRFQSIYGMYSTPGNKPLSLRIEAEAGTFYNGKRVSLSISPKWAVSRYLELSSLLQWNRIEFPNRHLRYDVNLAQLRTKISLNTKVSADVLVQYSNVAKVVSSNVRFRYNPREGNDLYLVFNQGMWTNRFEQSQRTNFEPLKPLLSNRTIVVKYMYTFVKK